MRVSEAMTREVRVCNPGESILHDNALFRCKAQAGGTLQVRFWIRLALRDVIRRDE